MKTIVHFDPLAVARRLKELGLRLDLLMNPVHAAYQGWSNCTELDPRMYPGLTLWAVAIRHLRMGLIPLGWTKKEDGNYSLTISPDGKFAIAVATGDELTGFPDESPSTQSRKGLRTVEALAANNLQLGLKLEFPPGLEPLLLDPIKFGDHATWLLLLHRQENSIRVELSHPLGFDEDQRVTGWKERIILPEIELSSIEGPKYDEQPDMVVDVPVRRRG